MEIAALTTNPATPVTQSTEVANALSSDFETFLKMLTVQMKNQDPLDPVKSEDFAVQLATFSGVEQQVQTNNLLQALGAQMGLMGMSQLAGWVGMEARAPVAAFFDGAPIELVPEPRHTADSATLVVRDANGTEVQRLPIPIADDPLLWTGVAADGSALPYGAYSFSVESYSGGALIASTPTEVYTRIIEARIAGGQTLLVTETGDEVPATSVSGIREPVVTS